MNLDDICPPGEIRVIDRRPQPCPECKGKGRFYEMGRWYDCTGPCRGRGTVGGDRVLGLKPIDPFPHPELFRLVDLPEGQER